VSQTFVILIIACCVALFLWR